MIPVVAAIICNVHGEILFAQRSLNARSCAGLWEFPGGKIQTGETPESALKREILEELKMQITVERAFAKTLHKEPGKIEIQLEAYLARAESLNFELSVHECALWLKKEKAQNLNFAPADIPIFNELLVTNWP